MVGVGPATLLDLALNQLHLVVQDDQSGLIFGVAAVLALAQQHHFLLQLDSGLVLHTSHWLTGVDEGFVDRSFSGPYQPNIFLVKSGFVG